MSCVATIVAAVVENAVRAATMLAGVAVIIAGATVTVACLADIVADVAVIVADVAVTEALCSPNCSVCRLL